MKMPFYKLTAVLPALLVVTYFQSSFADQVTEVKKKDYVIVPESSTSLGNSDKTNIVKIAKTADVVPADQAYPAAAQRQTYQDEITQIKETEESERRQTRMQDEYERKKADAQQEMEAKKYQIQSYKFRQDKAETEMDDMQSELTDVNKQQKEISAELMQVESQAQEHFALTDKTRRELEDRKKTLADTVNSLSDKKDKLSKAIYNDQMQIQQMKADVAVLESQVDEADANIADIEANEMKVRTEWLAYKQQIGDLNAQRNDYLNNLQEAKTRYAAAEKDLKVAQGEYAKAEKERAQTASMTQGQVAKYEQQIIQATRDKTIAMAEKIRVEAEKDKLNAYVQMVQKSKNQAVAEEKDSEYTLMQSRLALGTSKSELTREIASSESEEYRSRKKEARLRGMDSAQKAADMLEDGKRWISTKMCPTYTHPTTSSREIASVKPGEQLAATEMSGAWVKLMNGSADPTFVDKNCGRFEAAH